MAEFDYTNAVDVGARVWWEEHGTVDVEGDAGPLPWEMVPGSVKSQIRMILFEAIVAAIDAAFEQKEIEDLGKMFEQ